MERNEKGETDRGYLVKKNYLDNLTAISFFRHASLHFSPSFARRLYCFVERLLRSIVSKERKKELATRSATVLFFLTQISHCYTSDYSAIIYT